MTRPTWETKLELAQFTWRSLAMRNPICLWMTIWRSITIGANVSGHDYKTSDEKTPPNVHVLECMRCGKVSVAWDWTSMEHLK